MLLGRHLGSILIHALDIKGVGSFLALAQLLRVLDEGSYSFSDSCTWVILRVFFTNSRLVPSTAKHSEKTCPVLRGSGVGMMPRQAGQ